jgi:hypothetical protein
MKYYITQQELAQGISAIKAQQMGCTGVTAFWWGVIKRPILNEAALAIPDEETVLAPAIYNEENELFTPAETVKTLYENGDFIITTDDLVSHDVLESEGWFASQSAT